MTWDPGFTLRPLHAGDELFVGDWCCPGGRPGATWERARHLELDLQREGSHVRGAGARRVVVDPTLATLHAAGEEYRMASTGQPQRSTIVLLRGALADELGARLPGAAWRVSAAGATLHAALLRATEPLAREEIAIALLACLAGDEAPVDRAVPASWRRLAATVAELVAARHAERLTLEGLAAAAGASPFHVSRVFRRVTGERLHRHLTRVRLRVALFRLPEHAGRLAELALACGFSSHSHFTSAFRAEYGVSPSGLAVSSRP